MTSRITIAFSFIICFSFQVKTQDVITVKPNGDTVRYSNGDIRNHKDRCVDGKRIALYKKKVISLIEIKNCVFNGSYLEFYETGKIKLVGSYINGKKKGIWYYFDRSGYYLREENW